MGHVGGELPPVPLGKGPLRHVEHQQHRARRASLRLDARHVELVLPAVPLAAEFAVSLLRRLTQRVAQRDVPIHRQKILSHTVFRRVQQPSGRRIDAQDDPRLVQQHQALAHAAGDLLKFLRPTAQLVHLPVDLAALMLHAPQQGRQLLVGVVLQRMLQIQPVQRLRDAPRQPGRQHA